MGIFRKLITTAALSLALASCATEKTVKTHIDKPVTENSEKKSGEETQKEDFLKRIESSIASKGGGMRTDKRSAFEGSAYDGKKDGGFERKEYGKKDFDNSNKEYSVSNWDGSKSYKDGNMSTPEFINKAAASIKNKPSDFSDKAYATSQSTDFAKPFDGTDKQPNLPNETYITDKRDAIARPKIISTADQQQKSVEEIRQIMGRGDN